MIKVSHPEAADQKDGFDEHNLEQWAARDVDEMYDWWIDVLIETLCELSGDAWSERLERVWRKQLEITGQEDFLDLPYHKMILNDEIPLSIGGGIGQSRIYSYILKKVALGEVSVTIWPEQLHEICEERNIHMLR